MGWCCPDAERYECQENSALEMFCSYGQSFYEELRYFSCVRNTQSCATSQKLFFATPNTNQTLILQKKDPDGVESTFGDVCWYDIRQTY